MAADAVRMAESLSLGGAPGSRRLDLRHRRSHSNDQHLTVSASGSLSLHHHQPHGASIGYYISHHKHQDNNRTRAMHALELYVVTKLTNKSARHYGLLLHLTVRGYHGSYGLTGTKTFSKVWLCGNQPIYALKGVAFTGLGYHYQPTAELLLDRCMMMMHGHDAAKNMDT